MAGSKITEEFIQPNGFISGSNLSSKYGISAKFRFFVQLVTGGTGARQILPLLGDLDRGEQSISWNAISASVPGVSMEIGSSIVGQRPRFYGTERSDQDLQLTFVESSDMPLRKFFSRWIDFIWSPYDLVRWYPEEYTLDSINVWSYTPEGLGAYYDQFKDVFPYEIADLDWDTNDTSEVMTTQVKFKYRIHTLRDHDDNSSIRNG